MINQITFIYNTQADICLLRKDKLLLELTIKGSCEYQGKINGTWFQVDEQVNHWISFRRDRFQANKWEVFYKSIQNDEIKYYRRIFYEVKEILTCSFTEKDEWIKIDGKWRSRF